MKTFIFVLTFFAFLAYEATAQSSFNLEGGLNFATVEITGLSPVEPQLRKGYFLGFRHDILLNEKLSFNYSLQYTQDGYADNRSIGISAPTVIEGIEYRYQYFRFIPHIEFQPYSAIGIFVGPNLGAGFKEEVRSNETRWFDAGSDDFIEHVDFGLTVGARCHLNRITISASYNHGLTKNYNRNRSSVNGGEFTRDYEKNRSIQIGVGYAFIKR